MASETESEVPHYTEIGPLPRYTCMACPKIYYFRDVPISACVCGGPITRNGAFDYKRCEVVGATDLCDFSEAMYLPWKSHKQAHKSNA